MQSPEQFESAKRELVIQKGIEHPNVVKSYEYIETEEEFRHYMEYLNMSDYLCDKIEEVLCQYIS